MSQSTPNREKHTASEHRPRIDYELVGAARAALGVLFENPSRWHTARTIELTVVGHEHATLRRALGQLAAAGCLQSRHAADRATGYRPAANLLDHAPTCEECDQFVVAIDEIGDEPTGWPCGHRAAVEGGRSYAGDLVEVFGPI